MNKKRTWLATALVAFLTLTITSGIVLARSHTETKLVDAVANGKLTQEQADTKLEHFNNMRSKMTKPFSHKHRPTLEDITTKLADAVANGKLTQEQADTKLEHFNNMRSKMTKPFSHKHRPTLEDITTKLADAVANGKLTQEQADTKLATWRDKESKPRRVW